MPIISRFISTYLTTYFYMLLIAYSFLVIIFSRGMESINKYCALLIPFLFFEGLTFFIRTNSIIEWGYQVLIFLLPIVVGYALLYESYARIERLSNVICFALVITAITSVIGLVQ